MSSHAHRRYHQHMDEDECEYIQQTNVEAHIKHCKDMNKKGHKNIQEANAHAYGRYCQYMEERQACTHLPDRCNSPY